MLLVAPGQVSLDSVAPVKVCWVICALDRELSHATKVRLNGIQP
jgi:hypothetical protein